MIFIVNLSGILLGFAFPVLLIKAIEIRPEESDRKLKYVILSSLCCGIIMFIIMGLLPNT